MNIIKTLNKKITVVYCSAKNKFSHPHTECDFNI